MAVEDNRVQGEGQFGHSRREFLGALSAALGVTLAADLDGLEGLAEQAYGFSSNLPAGYKFQRVFTVDGGYPGLERVKKVLPGVMINDRSEVIFHAVEKNGDRAVYRMKVGRGDDPHFVRSRLIVRTGQKLPGPGNVTADKISAGDTNHRGTYVTVIRGKQHFNRVYIQRPGHDIRLLVREGDRIPGGHGNFNGSFGDIDVDGNDDILLVARYAVPARNRHGLFLLKHATSGRHGRLLLRSGHMMPQARALITQLGLIERSGEFFIQQVHGRPVGRKTPKHQRMLPSAFLLGRLDRGRHGARLLGASRELRAAQSVLNGMALVGPRVNSRGDVGTVLHRTPSHMVLHRHDVHERGSQALAHGGPGPRATRLTETGRPTEHGSRIETISAPVWGPGDLFFYRVMSKRKMELVVVSGNERKLLLTSGDRVDGERIAAFDVGWHTDQIDSRGRMAMQVHLDEERTGIVVGTPI